MNKKLGITIIGALLLSSCSLIYKAPIKSGVFISEKQVSSLTVGKTRDDVINILGTPGIISGEGNVWIYVDRNVGTHDEVTGKTVEIIFENDLIKEIIVKDITK